MTKEKKENKLNHTFLAVDTAYFNSGLKPIEMLILSKVDEFVDKGMECYITNEQFATYFNVNKETIKRSLNNLEEQGYIKRNTELCSDRGQASRKRTIERGEAWYKNILPHQMLLS